MPWARARPRREKLPLLVDYQTEYIEVFEILAKTVKYRPKRISNKTGAGQTGHGIGGFSGWYCYRFMKGWALSANAY